MQIRCCLKILNYIHAQVGQGDEISEKSALSACQEIKSSGNGVIFVPCSFVIHLCGAFVLANHFVPVVIAFKVHKLTHSPTGRNIC